MTNNLGNIGNNSFVVECITVHDNAVRMLHLLYLSILCQCFSGSTETVGDFSIFGVSFDSV